MPYLNAYENIADPRALQKHVMAVVKHAVAVCAEAPATQYHAERRALAAQVFADPEGAGRKFCYLWAAQSGGASDAAIDTSVAANWNALAGV